MMREGSKVTDVAIKWLRQHRKTIHQSLSFCSPITLTHIFHIRQNHLMTQNMMIPIREKLMEQMLYCVRTEMVEKTIPTRCGAYSGFI